MLTIIGSENLSKNAVKLQKHFERIIKIAKAISLEFNNKHLYSRILNEAQTITKAEGGTLFLLNENQELPALEIILMQNSRGVIGGTATDIDADFPALPLKDPKTGLPNENNISTYCANTGHTVSIADIYDTDSFDFSGAHQFDQENDFHTQSILSVPLYGVNNHIIGVLQLINFKNSLGEIISFDEELLPLVEALSSLATLAMEKQLMVDSQEDLLIRLAAEPSPDHLYERILNEAQTITNADGGTLYLLKDDDKPRLEFAVVHSKSLNISSGGTSGNAIEYDPIYLYDEQSDENHNNVASHVALTAQVVNIPDAYTNTEFDFSGTKTFDQLTGYKSCSFLTIPLLNQTQEVIGVLQLLNATDPKTNEVVAFNPKLEAIIGALASYAAIMLSNQLYLKELKDLMDAFVKCIAQAIDAKSSHTSAHCQRLPRIMELLSNAACEDQQHPFKDFDLSEDEKYEIMVSSWMHDCGKLATPDRVLDKATKLQTIRDGIEVIKVRFASKANELKVQHLNMESTEEKATSDSKQELEKALEQLADDLEFIKTANRGGEFMADENKSRIYKIAQQFWTDFAGNKQPLLTEEEVYNLCITKGTLTTEERDIINNHMAVTIDMLNSLPFPKKLRNVPEIAGGHHEKMDGTGFPKGLTGDQMSIPARMMSIADIFEALTSKERPYKDPMKLSQALSILSTMSKTGHIDPDIFKLFLRSKVWQVYAKEHCLYEQLDISDYQQYL